MQLSNTITHLDQKRVKLKALDAALLAIRSKLERESYLNLMALYGLELPRHRTREFDRLFFPEQLRLLNRFCEAGDWIDANLLALTEAQLSALEFFDVIEISEGRIRLAGLRLMVNFGCLIFCSDERPDAPAYYGEDTMALSRHILTVSPGKSFLDMCGGVATQGILAARLGCKVTSIEINADLEHLRYMNSVINQVKDSVRLLTGNLYDPLEDKGRQQTFDYIFANPPLIPMGETASIGLPSDGGEDGLRVTKAICSGAKDRLKPGGRLIIQGLSFGSCQAPQISDLEFELYNCGFHVNLFNIYAEDITENSDAHPILDAMTSTRRQTLASHVKLTSAYEAYIQTHGFTHLHAWQFVAEKSETGAAALQTTAFQFRNNKLWNI